MKKNYILLLLLCLCFAGCKEKTVVESDYLPIADPYVMLYEGKYYAYGTGGTVEGEGFACFSSDDLKTGRVKARRCRQQIPTVRGDSGRRRSTTSNRKRSFICSTPPRSISAWQRQMFPKVRSVRK